MCPQLQYPIALLSLTLLVAGCAETPKVFRFDNTSQETPKVWPAGTEKPRYGYIGELTGENNFRPEKLETRSTATKLFEWLTGLAGHNPDPVVLRRPQCGTVDAEGRIFVTDISRAAVYVFDKPAGQLEIWDRARANVPFVSPIGIALGAQGEILVADAELHSVIRLDRKGNPVGEFGQDILKRPTGLARDPQRGQVYVADTRTHDIKVFTDGGKLLKIIGRRGEGTSEFNSPTHLAFALDKLYVTDTLNSRIQVLDPDGNVVRKFGKRGLYVGDMVRPKGVAVDSESNIYVIESLYDNLLVFDNQGRTLLALGGTGKETGEFYLPSGVWTDSHDQIYISDMFNGRITVLQFFGGAQ
ncbi:MAG: 6-bladed beta-propeller [Pseudomonadota bacterium]